MPIYIFSCDCGYSEEKILGINGEAPHCPKCGAEMRKKPTFPAMVKMKGMGGYPSRRKEWRGTAPYTRGYDSTTDPKSDLYKGAKHLPMAESE